MYRLYDDILTITVNDWCRAGLSRNVFEHDSKRGDLSIYKRGINGNTLIDVRSIKRPERLRVIEAAYGKLEKVAGKSIFMMEIMSDARPFFLSYEYNGARIEDAAKIEEYVNRASILDVLKRGLMKQRAERAKTGKRINMGEFYKLALDFYNEQAKLYPCTMLSNSRSLERVFKAYLKDGLESVVNKALGNDSARKVSSSIEKLLIALWRTNDKPFVSRVHELYNEFISAGRELYDKNTGEVFRPEDFYKSGRAIEISVPTVWNYLKSVVNETIAFADRNGNFEYVNTRRPKHHRHVGKFSLSKISMDDVCISRKSLRGDVYRYIAVDVVSGYWFRPAYIVGKPTLDTVCDAFRNMFCELTLMNMPLPGELEVEKHLMKDIDWLNDVFQIVRFCESPTEKRAEHNIKSLKYGVSKKNNHTRGRFYAKHEAYKCVRNKVNGDFIEPKYQPQAIIADDLADIEEHNNKLHPLQKTYPGMTRRDVLMKQVNPNLKPIEHWYLYQFIGNETETSIYNNDFCPVQHEKFELMDFTCLKKLKSNNLNVKAYWLPNNDGGIDKVYLYQDGIYIGEALNRSAFDYNECAIERTDDDDAKIQYQSKRIAKYDKFIRDERREVPAIGHANIDRLVNADTIDSKVVENGCDEQEQMALLECSFDNNDWKTIGINSL